MTKKTIDINADVGEGIGNEFQLMTYLSSCNIACGGHAGDFDTMKRVIKLAKEHGVKIGAHPSFPDKVNFGRHVMDITRLDLFNSIKNQTEDLIKVLNREDALLHHIKPHGALYNLAAVDEDIANIIIEVVKSIGLPLKLYVPYKSVIADLAQKENIQIIYEAFADRNYNNDLTLVSRTEPNAVITDPKLVFAHVFYMISMQKVNTIQNTKVNIKADTFCIHGDNPKALNVIDYLNKKLAINGYRIR